MKHNPEVWQMYFIASRQGGYFTGRGPGEIEMSELYDWAGFYRLELERQAGK